MLVDQDKLNDQDNAELLRWMWQHLGAPHRGEEMPEIFLKCIVSHVWRQVSNKDRVISCTVQATASKRALCSCYVLSRGTQV